MKAWLDGGLKAVGINLIFVIIDFIIFYIYSNDGSPEAALGLLFQGVFLFCLLPISFIIGALIGNWIEKRKSKK